ncbi:MAG: hypothetical protein BAJALOKI3v1_390005 [Promethearchaeota archaeon]|nr:MAG: hypothetical protein BAJALOKI3v1_390005 [Candidatus Lokiarchaeota archaeon]
MKKFENLIDSEGSVEGKINKIDIIKERNIKIAIIKIAKDQEIVPHPENYAVFFFIIQGSAIFTTGNGTYKIIKNKAIYYDPNEIRGIKPLEDSILLGIQIFD